ncbi:MAG: DUF5050 domain-containing protein [Lachnospiraceae bacterium]|nr:DUF5050 domain-containing protein [Lachnospiraceae bacterium]
MQSKDAQSAEQNNQTIAELISSGKPLSEKKSMRIIRSVLRQLIKDREKESAAAAVLTPQMVTLSPKGAVTIAYEKSRDTASLGRDAEAFLPPEYGKGTGSDEGTLIYGIGMMLLMLVTGKTQKSELDAVSKNGTLKEIVDRCTALDQRRRFQSLLECYGFVKSELRFPKKRLRRIAFLLILLLTVGISVYGYLQGHDKGSESGRKTGYQSGYREGYDQGVSDAPGIGIEATAWPSDTGNYPGNRNSKEGAFAVMEEDNLYYICDNRVFRMDPYTKETTQLVKHESISELNCWNGYLYYLTEDSIMRFRIETGEEEIVSDSVRGRYAIYSGMLYVDDEKGPGYLYGIDTETLEMKQLNANPVHDYLNVSGGRLLFTDPSRDDCLVSCEADGDKLYRLVSKPCREVNLCGEKIYCLTDNGDKSLTVLIAMNSDGGDALTLTNEPVSRFIASDNGIFYISAATKSLEWMTLDGKTRYTVSTQEVTDFNLAGRWIFYRISGSDALYRMRIDGSDSERIPQSINVYQ